MRVTKESRHLYEMCPTCWAPKARDRPCALCARREADLQQSANQEIAVIRITAPHFVAGVVPHNGRVVNAAPILRYMLHWTGKQVADYCKRKGWAWERVMRGADAALAEGDGNDGRR